MLRAMSAGASSKKNLLLGTTVGTAITMATYYHNNNMSMPQTVQDIMMIPSASSYISLVSCVIDYIANGHLH